MIDADEDGVISEPFRRFVRNAYNYDTEYVSRETGLLCEEPTLTQQQFKEECDINVIVERFGITGQLPIDQRVPLADEFMDILSYQDAVNLMKDAEESFMAFPAHVRDQFANDPGRFVEFASDPANLDQMTKWGMAPPRVVVPEPPKAPD